MHLQRSLRQLRLEFLEERRLLACTPSIDTYACTSLNPHEYERDISAARRGGFDGIQLQGSGTSEEQIGFSLIPGDKISLDIVPSDWQYDLSFGSEMYVGAGGTHFAGFIHLVDQEIVTQSLSVQAVSNETGRSVEGRTDTVSTVRGELGKNEPGLVASTTLVNEIDVYRPDLIGSPRYTGSASASGSMSYSVDQSHATLDVRFDYTASVGGLSINPPEFGVEHPSNETGTNPLTATGSVEIGASGGGPGGPEYVANFAGVFPYIGNYPTKSATVEQTPLQNWGYVKTATQAGPGDTTGSASGSKTWRIERYADLEPSFEIIPPSGGDPIPFSGEFVAQEAGLFQLVVKDSAGRTTPLPYDGNVNVAFTRIKVDARYAENVIENDPLLGLTEDFINVDYDFLDGTPSDTTVEFQWKGTGSRYQQPVPGASAKLSDIYAGTGRAFESPFFQYPSDQLVVTVAGGSESVSAIVDLPKFDLSVYEPWADSESVWISTNIEGRSGLPLSAFHLSWISSADATDEEGVPAIDSALLDRYITNASTVKSRRSFDPAISIPISDLSRPADARYLRVKIEAKDVQESDTQNNVSVLDIAPDLDAYRLQWDEENGGAILEFETANSGFWLEEDVQATFYWSDTSDLDNDSEEIDAAIEKVRKGVLRIRPDAFKDHDVRAYLISEISFTNNQVRDLERSVDPTMRNNKRPRHFDFDNYAPNLKLIGVDRKSGSRTLWRKAPFDLAIEVTNRAPIPIDVVVSSLAEGIADAEVSSGVLLGKDQNQFFWEHTSFGETFSCSDCSIPVDFNESSMLPLSGVNSKLDRVLGLAGFNYSWHWFDENRSYVETQVTNALGSLLGELAEKASVRGLRDFLEEVAAQGLGGGVGTGVGGIVSVIFAALEDSNVQLNTTAELSFNVEHSVFGRLSTTDAKVPLGVPEARIRDLINYTWNTVLADLANTAWWSTITSTVTSAGAIAPVGVAATVIGMGGEVLFRARANEFYYQAIDPPSPDYRMVSSANLVDHTATSDPWQNLALGRKANLATLSDAMAKGRDRALGAEIEQEWEWQANQLVGISQHAHEAVILSALDITTSNTISARLGVTPNSIAAAKQSLQTNGIPADVRSALLDLGWTDQRIDNGVQSFLNGPTTSASLENLHDARVFENRMLAQYAFTDLLSAIGLRTTKLGQPVQNLPSDVLADLGDRANQIRTESETEDNLPHANHRNEILSLLDDTRYWILRTNNAEILSPILDDGYLALIALQNRRITPDDITARIESLEPEIPDLASVKVSLKNASTELESLQIAMAGESIAEADTALAAVSIIEPEVKSELQGAIRYLLHAYDSHQPTAVANDIVFEIDQLGREILPLDVDNGSSDDISVLRRTLNIDQFEIADIGEHEVVLTVTDTAGRSSQTTAIVTVRLDETPPVAVANNVEVQLDSLGRGTITVEDVDGGSYDNFRLDHLELSRTNFTLSDIGENVVTFTATDTTGNKTTVQAVVTVLPPKFPILKSLVHPDTGHTYHLVRGEGGVRGISWIDAEAAAQELGGHLVTINDMAENQWIRHNIVPEEVLMSDPEFGEFPVYADSMIWIGAEQTDGVWAWTSGEPFAYENWLRPDPWGRGFLTVDGDWFDTGAFPSSREDDYVGEPFDPHSALIEIPTAILKSPKISGVQLRPASQEVSFFSKIDESGNVPWPIDAIQIVFDQEVVVRQHDLVLTVAGVDEPQVATSFSSDGNKATWAFNELADGAYKINLNSSAIVGASGGTLLDGEFESFATPSGNVSEGGQYHAVFRILSGDTNHDGLVTGADLDPIAAAFLSAFGDDNFNIAADLNMDGLVTGEDLDIISENFLQQTSTDEPPDHSFAPDTASIAAAAAFNLDTESWDDKEDGEQIDDPSSSSYLLPAIQHARQSARRTRILSQRFF